MRFKNIFISFLIVGLIIFGLTSTAFSRSMKTPEDTFVYAMRGPAESLDPGINDVQPGEIILRNVYGTLVKNGPAGDNKLYPNLAKSWNISEDGKTFTINLREGVKFHNGNAFTAEDVIYTFQRAIGIGRIPGQKLVESNSWDSIKKIDKYTVEITTKQPAPTLMNYLAQTSYSMIDKDWALKHGDEALEGDPASYVSNHTNGTGPYELVEYEPREFLRFKKFDDYWKGWEGKHVEEVRLNIVPEFSTRLMKLLGGKTDYIDIPKAHLGDVEGVEDIVVDYTGLDNYVLYIWFNTKEEFLENKKVRQALNYSFPYEQVLSVAFGDSVVRANSFLGKTTYDYPEGVTWYKHDIEKAKELLEEAGYGDGYSKTLTFYYDTGRPARKRTGLIWKQELKKLGIDIELQQRDWPVMAEKVAVGDIQLYASGNWGNLPASFEYARNFGSAAAGEGGGYSYISNPEIDQLLEKVKVEADIERRKELFREIHERVKDLAPIICVNQNRAFQVYGSWLKGVKTYPWGQIRFYDLHK